MIKNIVFDLGNVLLEFKPVKYLKDRYSDPELVKNLNNIIFKSKEWIELDRGTISEEEAIELLSQRYPSYTGKIHQVFADWIDILKPMDDTIEILNELRKRNYGLYVLSNFHLKAFKRVFNKYSFFNRFDGLVISSKVNSIKPEPGIYEFLLARYQITPEKTVFIDDREENLETARRFNINTIHYIDPESLRQNLNKLGILE